MLFDGNISRAGAQKDLGDHPFQQPNNINGIDADPSVVCYQTPDNTILAIQNAYVDKLVDTLNDLPSVLWEIANEAGPESIAWQYNLIDRIHAREATKPLQHPVGITDPGWSPVDAALYASNAEWISPNNDTAAANGSKVIMLDNTTPASGETPTRSTSGKSSYVATTLSIWTLSIATLATKVPAWHWEKTRTYADRMNLASVTPKTDTALASSGYLLSGGNQWLTSSCQAAQPMSICPGHRAPFRFNGSTYSTAQPRLEHP